MGLDSSEEMIFLRLCKIDLASIRITESIPDHPTISNILVLRL